MEVATSNPQPKPQTINKQVTFQFANECDLEIHCSPFGLSGLYIKSMAPISWALGPPWG